MKLSQYMIPLVATSLLFFAGNAVAAGDAAKGEKEFRKCAACHALEEGKKKVGPSLYQIVGRQAGTVEGFKYSEDMIAAGKAGLKWTPENITAYLEDPKKYLAAFLKKDSAKSKMINKFPNLQMREDVIAYLASLNPPRQ